ncbi:hypothetical protein tinsulaeT_16430 [Thalassotalea insulae]|uniref:Mce/MlaD domain-containing protein n=1 Tax=Thalassotalea insulae TaxID=2056778 RepID=A0ABQ6GQR2_9GAMM|nr:MlaD family protein [Thalassotalea insulae]GLX78303.1 hypothetical protein tinsulaeT_16430 [Thalassotalea insulae]
MPKQTNSQIPKAYIKRKTGISAIWLVPIIALIFGAWLVVNAYLERGTYITVQFDSARGIVIGKTEVHYKGLTTGVVSDIEVADDLQSVIVEIEMVPNASKMLTDNTVFWYVTAEVSLKGITGLDTLLSGGYINMQPDLNAKGKPQRHFIAAKEPLIIEPSKPGLHLTLLSESLGSLKKNSPVSFKQIPVGHVTGFHYLDNSNQLKIGLFIEPEYAGLVKKNSRFWHASGFNVHASLTSGIEFNSESLTSIIAGGIAFDSPNNAANSENANEGQQFTLHPNFHAAEMGREITLILDLDSAIDQGTSIRLQNIAIGKVVAINKIDVEQQKIIAKAKINPRLEPYLTSDSQFYLVSSKISFAAASSIDKLLLGSYIGLQPSSAGEPSSSFTVYNQRPPYRYSTPGLHLSLTTTDSSAINVGAGVFYHQQLAGSVQAIERSNEQQALVHIHIKPEFQQLVSTSSKFWQIDGIKVNASLQGLTIQTPPLPALFNGGIAFGLEDKGNHEAKVTNGDRFPLTLNKQQAKQSLQFTLLADASFTIKKNTRLLYQGKVIGHIHYQNKHNGKTQLIAGILPQYQNILRENSQFWLVEPDLSLAGLNDTQALFGGSYILVSGGDGKATTEFNLAANPVAKHHSAAGLQLTLNAEQSYGLLPGSQISYKGLTVGQIDTVELDQATKDISLTLTIRSKYAHLINHTTRFFNTSGIAVHGNLSNFQLQTNSLASVVQGGISFYTPDSAVKIPRAKEGQNFTLFANLEQAKMAGITVTIHFNNLNGLSPGQAIKFQGHTVGKVQHLVLDPHGQGATVFAYLTNDQKQLAVTGTKFWLVSPKLNLLNSARFNQLIAGDFIQIFPGQGEAKTHFNAEDIPPAISSLHYGLNLTLSTKTLGSIRVGNPVMYRQVVVGQVIGVDLAKHADRVNIYLNIAERYAPLVTAESKFWNASGFELEAGLFSGLAINSESIESLLAGGIAFATPTVNSDNQQNMPSKKRFLLHSKAKPEWLAWAPKIPLEQ